jgi:Raf kinase inhibitor-like YbhB/YbcL family protein
MNFLVRSVNRVLIAVSGFVLLCIPALAANTDMLTGKKEEIVMAMTITSPAFVHNGTIPARHTCDGENISPQLEWHSVPAGAKSLALIVDDPDAPDPSAPKMTWVHWVLYDLPADTHGLIEHTVAETLPRGTLQGLNDWHSAGYGGPCPPIGKHRYFFRLYALNIVLPDLQSPTKSTLEKNMQGHVLAQSELIGLYQRQ